MTDASDPHSQTIVNEAYLTALRLFVLDSRLAEMQMSYLLADHADPQRLGDVSGKYVKRAIGYALINENGTAQAFSDLPGGVSPDDVVVDELDVSSSTPLQDRLRAIVHELRIGPSKDAQAEELAEAIDASLEACRPDNGERWFEQIKQSAQSEVFDANGLGDAKDMTERAHRFLNYLGQLVQDLQNGPLADGKTIGGVLAIRGLMLARAARAQDDPEDEMDALLQSLLYVTASGPVRIENVARGLCSWLVRRGEGDAALEAADGLKAEGDALIDRALSGDLLTFYASLYPAAAYELAAVHLGRAAAEVSSGPGEADRWGALAQNAEERAVRIVTALGFALMNLDGAWIPRHQLWLSRVREQKGDAAARLEAKNLINNLLYYPKALMPTLLCEGQPTDDRSQRP